MNEQMELLKKELEDTKKFCSDLENNKLEGDEGDSTEAKKWKKKIEILTNKSKQ
jgi:hypothetical protein